MNAGHFGTIYIMERYPTPNDDFDNNQVLFYRSIITENPQLMERALEISTDLEKFAEIQCSENDTRTNALVTVHTALQ